MADIPGLPPRAPAGRRLHNGPIPMTVPEVNASLMHALMITAHAFMIVTVEGPVFHMCICNVTTAPRTALMIALCARGGKVLWKNGRSSLRYNAANGKRRSRIRWLSCMTLQVHGKR